jgi:hypothetical protein
VRVKCENSIRIPNVAVAKGFEMNDTVRSKICVDTVFELSLENDLFTNLTLVCVKEDCKYLSSNIIF